MTQVLIVYESDHSVKAAINIGKAGMPCGECNGARGIVTCREPRRHEMADGSSRCVPRCNSQTGVPFWIALTRTSLVR